MKVKEKFDIISFLSHSPIFEKFSSEKIENIVNRLKVHEFIANDIIYRQNDSGNSLMIVYKGQFEMERNIRLNEFHK